MLEAVLNRSQKGEANPDFSLLEYLLKAEENIIATVQVYVFGGKERMHSTCWETGLSGMGAYNALLEFSKRFEGTPNYVRIVRGEETLTAQFSKFHELSFEPSELDNGKCSLLRLTGLQPNYGTDLVVDKNTPNTRLSVLSVYNTASLVAPYIMRTAVFSDKTSQQEIADALNQLYSGLTGISKA